MALLGSRVDQSCIKEGIVPTKYFQRTNEQWLAANGEPLQINYKLSKVVICNDEYCFRHSFIVVSNIYQDIILGTPFLIQIYPFSVDSEGINTNIIGRTIFFQISYHQ